MRIGCSNRHKPITAFQTQPTSGDWPGCVQSFPSAQYEVLEQAHFPVRVLVERIEGLCSKADWMRAYSEINDFEEQLTEAGIIIVKFWLAISEEEQLRRFKEREDTVYKRYKITPDDCRNRKKWDAY